MGIDQLPLGHWWVLLGEAIESYNMGDIQNALRLVNEAIEDAESCGKPAFNLRIQRAIFASGSTPDPSATVPVLEVAKEYFEQSGNTLLEIHYLMEMAKAVSLGRHHAQALLYVQQAKALSSQLTDENVEAIREKFYPHHQLIGDEVRADLTKRLTKLEKTIAKRISGE